MPDILRTESVSKAFGNHQAIDAVSFSLKEHTILGLLGPNGAGKTTLIRLITQIVLPDSGKIFYKGNPLQDKHRFEMGYLPEERGLYRKMKVKEQLLYFAELRGLSSKEAKKQVGEWCERLGLEALQDQVLETLSKGQQQKVQFISSVVHAPELLILDEPFSGFDPANSELIKKEIQRIHANGTTIIYSTHRMDTVENLCTDLILIDRSHIVLQGKPEEIRKQFDKGHIRIRYSGQIPEAVQSMIINRKSLPDGSIELVLLTTENKQEVLKAFMNKGAIHLFEEHLPDMHEIFLHVVKETHL